MPFVEATAGTKIDVFDGGATGFEFGSFEQTIHPPRRTRLAFMIDEHPETILERQFLQRRIAALLVESICLGIVSRKWRRVC